MCNVQSVIIWKSLKQLYSVFKCVTVQAFLNFYSWLHTAHCNHHTGDLSLWTTECVSCELQWCITCESLLVQYCEHRSACSCNAVEASKPWNDCNPNHDSHSCSIGVGLVTQWLHHSDHVGISMITGTVTQLDSMPQSLLYSLQPENSRWPPVCLVNGSTLPTFLARVWVKCTCRWK